MAEFVKEIKKILPDWKEYELSYIDSDVFVPYYPAWPGYPTYPIYTDGTGVITPGETTTITQKNDVLSTLTSN